VLSANFIEFAVLAKNEPFISKLAFYPKNIPLGLIKNKLALPLTPKVPKILEILLPVTLVIILLIKTGLLK
jgi:hypothetical protein